MPTQKLVKEIEELIAKASTTLPEDVYTAIKNAYDDKTETPRAKTILDTILKNANEAKLAQTPMCQDTGTLSFFVEAPHGINFLVIKEAIEEAVRNVTKNGFLRQNTILPIDGKSIADNVADGAPSIHFEPTDDDKIRIRLLLKGGGCENMSTQYSLPDSSLSAGRDLQGVRACILHAIWRAQGMGCAPGIIGVCIGGDRAEGYARAKKQLLRNLNDKNEVDILSELEEACLRDANALGIGPMGLGGNTTILGVKITGATRLPASFFVTIAYSCWALRRAEIVLDATIGDAQ